MSVTFTIDGNHDYCIAYGLQSYQEFDCYGNCRADCPECHGTNVVRLAIIPYEMNLANGNARTLLNGLGLDDTDLCGQCRPLTIIHAIKSTGANLFCRAQESGVGARGARLVNCGIDQEQAQSYLDRLMDIALEAQRRKRMVVWG